MSNELFKNVGTSIKAVAKTVANCIFLIAILCAALLVLEGCTMLDAGLSLGWIRLLTAAAVVGLGYALSRLAVMLLYAYGEITERVMSIDAKLSPAKQEKKAKTAEAQEAEQPVQKKRSGAWKCPFCEHLNSADAHWCASCGREDVFDDEIE